MNMLIMLTKVTNSGTSENFTLANHGLIYFDVCNALKC